VSTAGAWELSGPPGVLLDGLVVAAVGLGLGPEPVDIKGARHRYRVAGDDAELVAQIAKVADAGAAAGLSVDPETAPAAGVHLSARFNARPSARTTILHGSDPECTRWVARAVDAGLPVEMIGQYRYSVGGPTSRQMAWQAKAEGVALADVLARWNLTPEAVAAEDAAPLPVAVREFPARRSETVLTRDDAGQLLASVTTERTEGAV